MNAPARVPIFFPIEGRERELDSRLRLAHAIAREEPGVRIVIGSRAAVRPFLRAVPDGVILGKTLFTTGSDDRSRYEEVKSRGHAVVFLDEEGAVYPGDASELEARLQDRLPPGALREEDWVCAWGEAQARVFAVMQPRARQHVVATGHPRFELAAEADGPLWRQARADIERRFGRFVLVATNFAMANPVLPMREVFARVRRQPLVGYDPRRFAIGWCHERRMLTSFVEMVWRLARALPETNVVVRPHPSEDRSHYEAAFAGLANVHVVRRGPIAPWLQACVAVVQQSCTTAIEAYAARVPAINYAPFGETAGTKWLPNAFAPAARTVDDVVAFVRSPRPLDHEPPAAAREMLANLEGGSTAAVASVLCRAARERPAGRRAPRGTWARLCLAAETRAAGRAAFGAVRNKWWLRAESIAYPPHGRLELERRLARAASSSTSTSRIEPRWLGAHLIVLDGRAALDSAPLAGEEGG